MKNTVIRISWVFICIVLIRTSCLHAQVVNVTDFGAKPNSFMDATESVKQAIDACRDKPGANLVFPKGRYDFWPDKAEAREYFISNTTTEEECPSKVKTIGMLFENMKDLTIEGNGSLFVFHGKMITWALDHCENIRMQHFTIDFERPTMSELTFLSVTPDEITARVHPDSRYAITDSTLYWYGNKWLANKQNYFSILTDTLEGTELYSSFHPLLESRITELEPFHLKFEGNFEQVNYRPGKTLTTRDHIRDHVGVFIHRSKNVSLTGITLHYMHGLGIVSQFSENLNYSKVNITPSRGRTIAGFADGMHFSGCKGYIRVDSCCFNGLHDDPMNIHGTFLRITQIHTPTQVTVRFMHGQTYGFPGFLERDTVGFVRATSIRTVGQTVVRNVSRISDREMLLDLSTPLPKEIGIGDCLENLTWTPSLDVRNCRFEMTNTRGLLITTPRKVTVENNYFYRTGMYAIQIACDAGSWYESGEVKDVLIRNNTFEECGYNRPSDNYVIAVNPENHEWEKGHYVHRNIRIEGNTFKVFDDLVMKAKSVDGLTFQNNKVEHSTWISPVGNRAAGTAAYPTFLLERCTNVLIKNNNWNLQESLRIDCFGMKKNDLKTDTDKFMLKYNKN